MQMASSSFLQHLFMAAAITLAFSILCVSSDSSISQQLEVEEVVGRRGLKSFKEKVTGSNVTFDCSPSGPCVPCGSSEKKDEKYRCSETGYRIPLKCVKAEAGGDEGNDKKKQKGRSTMENINNMLISNMVLHDTEGLSTTIRHRNLLEDSSKTDGSETYTTYRSCIPAVNQEKLSVLGFEGIMLLLLMGSSFVIFKRKGISVMPGAVRVPSNPRF